MPAVVNSTLGSSFRTSGALGRRTWPFDSKNLTNRSRISALSIYPYSLPCSKTKRGGDRTVTPRVPLPSWDKSSESGCAATLATARVLARTLPLPLRFVRQLAALHLRLRGEILRDLLQLVGAPAQLRGYADGDERGWDERRRQYWSLRRRRQAVWADDTKCRMPTLCGALAPCDDAQARGHREERERTSFASLLRRHVGER